MNKKESLEYLNGCLEQLKNTTKEEYEKIKAKKNLNFEEHEED